MNIQRLRNLTTHRLHTQMQHIYEDIGFLTGEPGFMTHELPNAMRALDPYLRAKVDDARFWDGQYDTSHTGEIDVPPMNAGERAAFFERFNAMPDPLAGKPVVYVSV